MNKLKAVKAKSIRKTAKLCAALALAIFAASSVFAQNSVNNSQAGSGEVRKPAPISLLPIDAHAKFDGQAFFKTFRHAKGGDTGVLPKSLLAVAENVQGEGVPDCGHFIAEERPDYLAARLLKFFSE
jgi:hypothetical protein